VTSARKKNTTRKITGVSTRISDLKGLREVATRAKIDDRGRITIIVRKKKKRAIWLKLGWVQEKQLNTTQLIKQLSRVWVK
jgi:hypothetical protein